MEWLGASTLMTSSALAGPLGPVFFFFRKADVMPKQVAQPKPQRLLFVFWSTFLRYYCLPVDLPFFFWLPIFELPSQMSRCASRSELHVQTADDQNMANDVKMYVTCPDVLALV